MVELVGPLLDRIDIHIEVKPVEYKSLRQENSKLSSKTIKERVNKARNVQSKRYENSDIIQNSELTPKLIEKYCKLNSECQDILKKAFEKLNFSAREYSKILKVARTIADVDGNENIEKENILEAIQYRNLDRKYWNN